MTSSEEPTDGIEEAVQTARPGGDPETMRQLADQLHRNITQTLADWNVSVNATPEKAPPSAPPFRSAR